MSASPTVAPAPRLLRQVRQAARVHHYSPRTEEAYVAWVRRYVRYHGLRHPAELGAREVRAFLTALAERRKLSASSQTQALSALLFLYREVLGRELTQAGDIVRAKQPSRLPVVAAGNDMWSVNVVVGDEDETYISDSTKLRRYWDRQAGA